MRVLVTGAAGFVGRHLVAHLRSSGDQVVAWDPPPVGPDICEPQQVDAELGRIVAGGDLDGVYHLAGQAHVGRSWLEPGPTLEANAAGSANLAHGLAQIGFTARFLLMSSAEVYGTPSERGASTRMPETKEVEPASPYAVSKVAAEQILGVLAARAGFELVICRPFNQIGPGQRSDFVASAFARRVVANEVAVREREVVEPARLPVGNLSAVRDFVDVRDAVVAYRLLMAESGSAGVFNICRGEGHAIADLVELMVRASPVGHDVFVDENLVRPNDIEHLVGAPERLQRATGWEPKLSLEVSVGDVLTEWRTMGVGS